MARIGSASPERICLICSACCVARRQRTSNEARACSSSCNAAVPSQQQFADLLAQRRAKGFPAVAAAGFAVQNGQRRLRVEPAQGLEVPFHVAIIATPVPHQQQRRPAGNGQTQGQHGNAQGPGTAVDQPAAEPCQAHAGRKRQCRTRQQVVCLYALHQMLIRPSTSGLAHTAPRSPAIVECQKRDVVDNSRRRNRAVRQPPTSAGGYEMLI